MQVTRDMGHFYRYSEQRRLETISQMVVADPGVTRILDVGSGIGELSGLIRSRHGSGVRVIATDLGFDSIHRAAGMCAERGSDSPEVRFVQGDIYRLPYGDGSFDAVVASEILEHLEEPRDAVREIARVIRPGGFVVLSTPYREKMRYTLCIHCNKKTPVNAHLHSFDDTVLQALLTEAGFIPEKRIKFSSRYADLLGLPGLSFFLPYRVWYAIDALLCAVFGMESFIAIRARRRD